MDLCPNCGKGYMLIDFSKKRKVYAGSTTKSSYSIGKGLVGAAILGPVGGLAGIGGKKETTNHYNMIYVYKCNKCGYIREEVN